MENLQNITNKVEFIDFLKKESNDYSNFILERIDRNVEEIKTFASITHRHHIIPKHQSGPDKKFNIIELTIEEHAEAHQLLYLCYQDKNDIAAFHMISGLVKQGQQIIWTLNQEKMRQNQRGFFSSEVQKELANRPRKPRTPKARNEFVIQALYRGILLEHIETKTEFEFFDSVSIIEIATELMSHPLLEKDRPKWEQEKYKSQTYIVQGFTKLITGNISTDKKMNFSILGFRVIGIRTQIE